MVETVLVTGASGFVASHCIKQLLEDGIYRVRGTVRSLKNEERVNAIRNIVPDAKFPLELVEADLENEECWKDAVKDCSYVLHVASPVPKEAPKDENEIIKPAVDGVKNVLSACAEVGGIKRVVLTSSFAAIFPGHVDQPEPINESNWADLDVCGAYEKSKTIAEKAAWDFVKNLPEDKKFELAVINPGAVIGPIILNIESSGVLFMKKLLSREFPMVPDIAIGCIDARDVALAHITAMTLPEAAGNRHILALHRTFHDIALALNDEFEPQGYNVPTTKAPKFLVWLLSWFNPQLTILLPQVGKTNWKLSNDRMVKVLGIEPRDTKEAAISMGYSLIELGIVKKTAKYRGRVEQKKD